MKSLFNIFSKLVHGKHAKLLSTITLVIFIIAFFICRMGAYANDVNEVLSENLVRLHVIANSDSHEDQQLKYIVRDVVIEYMKDKLIDSKNIDESMNIINDNLSNVIELAENTIKDNGYNYPVKAMADIYPFPTKNYGDITLPAGYYQALRIEIGEGVGENWWCVLFPPLCFVDVAHGSIPDTVKDQLKGSLTEEEYRIIATAENEEDIPIKVKFKVVEFFQESKIKVTGMLDKILN